MKKIKYLLKRILKMDYKAFFDTVKNVSKKTNKPYLFILFDVIYCGLKYEAGYVDYNLFEMYKLNKKERSTIVTRGKNNKIINISFNDDKILRASPTIGKSISTFLPISAGSISM